MKNSDKYAKSLKNITEYSSLTSPLFIHNKDTFPNKHDNFNNDFTQYIPREQTVSFKRRPLLRRRQKQISTELMPLKVSNSLNEYVIIANSFFFSKCMLQCM